jgi:hypothetical protein
MQPLRRGQVRPCGGRIASFRSRGGEVAFRVDHAAVVAESCEDSRCTAIAVARFRQIILLVVNDAEVVEDESADGEAPRAARKTQRSFELAFRTVKIHPTQFEVSEARAEKHLHGAAELVANGRRPGEQIKTSPAGGLGLPILTAQGVQLSQLRFDEDQLFHVAARMGEPAHFLENCRGFVREPRTVVMHAQPAPEAHGVRSAEPPELAAPDRLERSHSFLVITCLLVKHAELLRESELPALR